jgi:hypothetical protein
MYRLNPWWVIVLVTAIVSFITIQSGAAWWQLFVVMFVTGFALVAVGHRLGVWVKKQP